MKIKKVYGIICLVIFPLSASQAWPANTFNSDSNYSITIAVTINKDDYIIGKLEYSNNTLQLVTFNPIGGVIYAEPYLFEILEKTIVTKNVHKIRCLPLNDKYGNAEITGTIDFSNELKPKIDLLNVGGDTYISNISEKGKKTHMEYIPNVWLGY
jgi:hypothetical protein